MLQRARDRLRTGWAKLGKHRRRLLLHIAVLFALGVIFALITLAHPFASLQWTFSDQLFLSESLPPDQPVIIAAVDDETLEQYGRLGEWPRSLHAKAIENLSQAGARVIGFDVLFAETSDEDAALADAMAEAGNVVQPILGTQGLPSRGAEKVFQKFLQPNPDLYPASSSLGHANVLPDPDGKVRRLPLVIEDPQGQGYPAFSLAMLYTYDNAHWDKAAQRWVCTEPFLVEDYSIHDGTLHLGDQRAIPVDASTSMRLNYVDKPGTFTRISYRDVIGANFDPELVKHKIVLVGVTAVGETDYWVTPVSGEKMFGVEIHANAIDTILRERFLIDIGEIPTLLIILLLAGIAGLSLPRLNLRWGGLLVVGLIVAYLASAFLAFDRGCILNIIYPPIALFLVYVASILCRITAEQVDKREVRDLFGKYVSPEVAGEILRLSDAEALRLGGEEREVTVLFADIRGFTELSEQTPPEGVVDMLNKYFSVIIARILANEGMINKFAGDNIMAVWNAPQSQPEHAFLAVRAALESQQAIREMQQRELGLPQVQFGFGINTGQAIAGNVGSVGRLEYTVIGDAVNLASRICGAAPGGQVWISDQTYEQIRERFQVKQLEPQYFKGKKEAVAIYQVESITSG